MSRQLVMLAAILLACFSTGATAATAEELRARLFDRVFHDPDEMNDLARQLAATWRGQAQQRPASPDIAPPAPPAIVHVAITGLQTLDVRHATEQLKLSLKTTDDQSGLRMACFDLMSPELAGSLHQYRSFCQETPIYQKTQDLVLVVRPRPFDLYVAAGLWQIYQVTVYDRGGLYHAYYKDGAAGSNLNDVAGDIGVKIVNGSQDIVAPTVTAARLLNTTVSLAARYPLLKLSVTVDDNLSGVPYLYVYAAPISGGPSRSFYVQPTQLGFGTAQRVDLNFATNQETSLGGWYITALYAYDQAGNYAYIADDATLDAIFSATGRGFNIVE
jgi:hypothetical protein